MSAEHPAPNIDPILTDVTCPDCGQRLSLCKSCNAPIEKRSKGFVFALVGLSILGICLIAAYVIAYVLIARDPSLLTRYLGKSPPNTWQMASIGEMFGGLNCVVSGLAFAAFVYSLAQQRRELRYQRHSMGESRKEMKLSIRAQVDSAKALSIQIKHMQLTATIDGLGALLRSFDAQIVSSLAAIQEIEDEGGDVNTLTTERSKLRQLKHSRDTTIGKLDEAINETPQLSNQ